MSLESSEPVVTTPPADTTTEAPLIEAPKELDSAKWAAIAKKEQRLVHEQLALRKRQDEVTAKEKELQTKLTPFQEFEVLKSKDPIAALRGLGFTETDIFNWLAQSEKKELTPEEKATQAAQTEIEKFKKEQAELAERQEKEKEAQVLTRFKGRIKDFLGKNKEKYEASADYGEIAEKAAYDIIEEVYRKAGEIVTIDEAFQMVEEYYEGEYERMSKYSKFQKKEEAVIAVPKKEEPVSRGTPKTLTNAAAPTLASTIKRKETPSEKRERLINQLKQTGLTK